jgi:hypothetical protein
MIATAGLLEMSEVIRKSYGYETVPIIMLCYVSDLAGFMSEHQFVAFMHILKRTVQRWNNNVDDVFGNDDVINSPLHRHLIKGQNPVLFTVTNKSGTSKRGRIQSKVAHLQQFRELHASACDIAESINAVYSPMLLLSVTKTLTSLTIILYYIIINFIVQEKSYFCKLSGNTSYVVQQDLLCWCASPL